AAAEGTELIIVDAKNDGATQVNQVQDLITRKIDGLIYIPAGATAASVPVQLAKAADIPVICVDRFPPDMRGDTFIASDSVESARILGEWVIEQTGGVGRVAVIHGQMGTTPQVDRTKGWETAMATAPGMVTVAENSADWDQAKAFTVAQDMLQKDPSISVFFGQCDTMALGAARAVELANLDHDVLVVGFDGDVAALKELKNGVFDATCTQQTQLMGKLAYDSVKKAIAGESIPQDQLQLATLTTIENVEGFIANHP
ncbi:MAG: substrate-binding domain-containing protein, partial [Sphaerochaetaceae bacterium]|nr:substrate-binding domain-containing protein [Sphaerochaetaceae bacterium]